MLIDAKLANLRGVLGTNKVPPHTSACHPSHVAPLTVTDYDTGDDDYQGRGLGPVAGAEPGRVELQLRSRRVREPGGGRVRRRLRRVSRADSQSNPSAKHPEGSSACRLTLLPPAQRVDERELEHNTHAKELSDTMQVRVTSASILRTTPSILWRRADNFFTASCRRGTGCTARRPSSPTPSRPTRHRAARSYVASVSIRPCSFPYADRHVSLHS